MVDRYAYRYAEVELQQKWSQTSFSGRTKGYPTDPLRSALFKDIEHRMKGSFVKKTTRKGNLLLLGVLANGDVTPALKDLIQIYGADAVRIALVLEKGDLAPEKMIGYWRFIHAFWETLSMPKDKKAHLIPLPVSLHHVLQSGDWYHALIKLRTLLRQFDGTEQMRQLLLILFYPFIPHVCLACGAEKAKMPKVLWLDSFFIEINGKHKGTLSILPDLSISEREKEALSFVENTLKIDPKTIIKTIRIDGKGINFVRKTD